MKNILFLLLFFFYSNSYSEEYNLIFNFSGSYKKNEMIFLDKAVFLIISMSQMTDNYEIIISYCLTSIKYNNKKIIIDFALQI